MSGIDRPSGKTPFHFEMRRAGELSETVWDSYRAILEGALAAQERNVKLTLHVFESGMETMERGAELNRLAALELAKRMRERREALEALSRDSTDAYEGFLGSLSPYYREVSESPGENLRGDDRD